MPVVEKTTPKGTVFQSEEGTNGASHRLTEVNLCNWRDLKTQTRTTSIHLEQQVGYVK